MTTILFSLLLFFVWGAVETLLVFLFVKNLLLLKKKTRSTKKLIINVLLYTVIVNIFAFAIINENYSVAWLMYIPFLLKSLLIISPYYEIKFKAVFIVAFLLLVCSTIANNIEIIENAIGIPKIPLSNFVDELISNILIIGLLGIIIYIQKYRYIDIYLEDLGYIDYILFLAIIYSVSIIENAMFSSSKYTDVARTVSAIAYVSVCILIGRTIITVAKNNTLEGINKILADQMKQTTAYYNELVEKENSTRKFRHDIKNLLFGLYSLIDQNKNQEALDYIKELEEICDQGKPKYQSGNFIADAILTEKSSKVAQKEIDINLEGSLPPNQIKDVDLVIVLSNLLDNAIEACEKIHGAKVINVHSVLTKSMWVLTVTNPSEKVRIGNSNEITTTKSETDIHGFGLKNVERVAQKYGGSMDIKYEGGVFSNKVTIIIN